LLLIVSNEIHTAKLGGRITGSGIDDMNSVICNQGVPPAAGDNHVNDNGHTGRILKFNPILITVPIPDPYSCFFPGSAPAPVLPQLSAPAA
jgi:hypothetical protein